MFKDIVFTPNEFAQLAKIEKTLIPSFENNGIINTHRKRIGNVDRKVLSLEEVQNFFKMLREFDEAKHAEVSAQLMGAGAEAAGSAIIVNDAIAAATKFIAANPKTKPRCSTT